MPEFSGPRNGPGAVARDLRSQLYQRPATVRQQRFQVIHRPQGAHASAAQQNSTAVARHPPFGGPCVQAIRCAPIGCVNMRQNSPKPQPANEMQVS